MFSETLFIMEYSWFCFILCFVAMTNLCKNAYRDTQFYLMCRAFNVYLTEKLEKCTS